MNVNGYEIKPGADLSRADLSGANLIGANLIGVDLSWAFGEPAYLPDGWEYKDGKISRKENS